MQRTENPWMLVQLQPAPQRFLAKSFLLNRAIALSGRQIENDLSTKVSRNLAQCGCSTTASVSGFHPENEVSTTSTRTKSYPAVGVQGQLINPDCSKEPL